jgi:hypothetical protein
MKKEDIEIKIHSLFLLKEIARHILQFSDYYQVNNLLEQLISKHEESLENENKERDCT